MSLPPVAVSPSTLSGPGEVSTWPSKSAYQSSPQLSKLKMKVHVHRDDAHFSYFELCPFLSSMLPAEMVTESLSWLFIPHVP